VSAAGATTAAWDFADGLQGWHAGGDVGNLRVENGALCGEVTGPDPILYSPDGIGVDVKHLPRVELVMHNETPVRNGRVYYRTSYAPGFAGSSVAFDMAGSSRGFVTYSVPMDGSPGWYGRLFQLRIDPGDFRRDRLAPAGRFAIRSIRLVGGD
jgi:hypothetical protein